MHFISFSRTLLWSMPAQEWAQNLWKFTHRITGSPFSSSLLFRIFPYPPTSVLWPPENSFSWFFWPESWISLRVSATHVLHCCAALQVRPTLGQSHEIRGENGERPYMTFRSFDSPSQSACFCYFAEFFGTCFLFLHFWLSSAKEMGLSGFIPLLLTSEILYLLQILSSTTVPSLCSSLFLLRFPKWPSLFLYQAIALALLCVKSVSPET